MNELAQALIAESYAAAPSHILEGLTDDLVHHELPNVPHTIYAELWHLTFWQQITLDWIAGIETPYPDKPSDGFPQSPSSESLEQLRYRFLHGAEQAARCRTGHHSSRPSNPLPVASRRPHPHHVRGRPAHLARRPQRLPPRPHRPSSPASASVAPSLRRLHLVRKGGWPTSLNSHKSGCPIFATASSSLRWAIFAAAKIPRL